MHTCGVREAGALYCWGGNDEGQLGDGTRTARLEPVLTTW
jgi:alpha-tubulin suppressor-like RCC1 family protein